MSDLTVVEAAGDGYGIGRAIASATTASREAVARLVRRAVQDHPTSDNAVRQAIHDLRRVLQLHSPSTLAQVEAMADGYQLAPDGLLVWLLGTYFRSVNASDQGCSVYAWSGARPPHEPWLAKNRDSDRRLQHMQTLVRATPDSGHAWAALSTAGAPGVHSAGMNVHGLAVADTHVPSTDIGIGLPRFSLMLHVLENCTSVAESLTYLRSVPRMGFGNLVLADAAGGMAVVECAHSRLEVLPANAGYVVATNHFVSTGLEQTCWQAADSEAGSNSRARHQSLERALARETSGTEADPIGVLADHHEPGPTCAHGTGSQDSVTIATIVCFPTRGVVQVGIGTPCVSRPETYTVQRAAREDAEEATGHD